MDRAPDQYPAGTGIVGPAVRTRNTGPPAAKGRGYRGLRRRASLRETATPGSSARETSCKTAAMPAKPEESIVGPLDVGQNTLPGFRSCWMERAKLQIHD